MRFSHFFIDRPIFAAVLSIILTLVGVISFRALPISEFPDIAPPTVQVTTVFAGATADVVSETVASPMIAVHGHIRNSGPSKPGGGF